MAIDIYKLPLKNRVVYSFVLEKENGNVNKFAKEIGYPQQVISRLFHVDKRTGKYPNVKDEVVDALCERYGISKDDFLQGRYGGIMEITAMRFGNGVEEKELGSIIKNRNGNGRPYYDTPFEMGYNLPFNDNTANPDFYIDFEPYNRCDLWCRATGLSMQPTICSGDAIALKKIEDFRYLVNNEIYAIVLKSGLRTIKRTWDNGDSYTLIADNKDCPNQTIPKEEILAVYRVLGSTKMF